MGGMKIFNTVRSREDMIEEIRTLRGTLKRKLEGPVRRKRDEEISASHMRKIVLSAVRACDHEIEKVTNGSNVIRNAVLKRLRREWFGESLCETTQGLLSVHLSATRSPTAFLL